MEDKSDFKNELNERVSEWEKQNQIRFNGSIDNSYRIRNSINRFFKAKIARKNVVTTILWHGVFSAVYTLPSLKIDKQSDKMNSPVGCCSQWALVASDWHSNFCGVFVVAVSLMNINWNHHEIAHFIEGGILGEMILEYSGIILNFRLKSLKNSMFGCHNKC